MNSYLVDIPVLLLFFNRPDKTSQVFEQIRKARPSKLYLYQDGAREGRPDDVENVKKCREVVENIDWECEVHRLYQEKNYGCDPSEFLSQKWMFETEEYGIVLEDDDVPALCFFQYCKELLEKYKDDDRIQMVCGYNPIDHHPSPDGADYFFSTVSSIWGWASWKRVIDTWDGNYSFMNDPEKLEKVISGFPTKKEQKYFRNVLKRHSSAGKEYYESINASNMYLYDRLAINPTHNMICNIGVGDNTTHSVSDLRMLPKSTQALLYKEVHEYEFPIKHPKKVVNNVSYKIAVDKALGFRGIKRYTSKIKSTFLTLRYKGISGVLERLKVKKQRKIAKI